MPPTPCGVETAATVVPSMTSSLLPFFIETGGRFLPNRPLLLIHTSVFEKFTDCRPATGSCCQREVPSHSARKRPDANPSSYFLGSTFSIQRRDLVFLSSGRAVRLLFDPALLGAGPVAARSSDRRAFCRNCPGAGRRPNVERDSLDRARSRHDGSDLPPPTRRSRRGSSCTAV